MITKVLDTYIEDQLSPTYPFILFSATGFFSGKFAIMTSAVSIKLAIEEAFCKAERVTLVVIKDTHSYWISIFLGSRVVTKVTFTFSNLSKHYRRFSTGVSYNFLQRFFQSAQHNLDTGILFSIFALQGADCSSGSQQCHATTGCNTFFHGSTSRMHGIFNAGFFSFIPVSVAEPTLITVTTPESLAVHSRNFSLS
ncbi:MAG: hypothetical protein K2P83_07095 [Nitrosomonas sp.]|nr:hypothetical protein [Nitrosomonas sp.]